MTTMLERAARAVIEADQDQWDLPAAEWDMKALEVHGALSIAHAVLMAVREPDMKMIIATNLCDDISESFTAMIDAILNETPE